MKRTIPEIRRVDLQSARDQNHVIRLHLELQAEGRRRYLMPPLSPAETALHEQGIIPYLARPEFGARIFVALAETGTPVAIAVCQTALSTWSLRPGLNIHDFYVEPPVRRQGVGRALLQGIVESARSEGFQAIKLETTLENTAARSLYHSFGFRNVFARELSPSTAGWDTFRTAVLQMRLDL